MNSFAADQPLKCIMSWASCLANALDNSSGTLISACNPDLIQYKIKNTISQPQDFWLDGPESRSRDGQQLSKQMISSQRCTNKTQALPTHEVI